tara:strand:- start:118 stop:903 length:786 start_codon:yes stop_codon:yes gene_type:complete
MSKTLILSDIHFCESALPDKTAQKFRNLFSGFDALILNGDTTEEHSLSSFEVSREQADALIKFASEDGLQTTVICGNHDPVSSDIDHIWLCDKSVLVFHGHAAFPGIAPWSWRSKYIKKSREEYIKVNGDGFDEQLAAVRQASHEAASGKHKDKRPSLPHMFLLGIPAFFHVLNSWRKFPNLVSDWVERYAPSAKYVITGHTHHAGIWTRNNRVIINTGCFSFPSHPRAVILENDTITVHRLVLSNGNYSFGRVCASWNVR